MEPIIAAVVGKLERGLLLASRQPTSTVNFLSFQPRILRSVGIARPRSWRDVALLRATALLGWVALLTACVHPSPAGHAPAPAAPLATVAQYSELLQLASFDTARLAHAIFEETNRVRRQLALRPFDHVDALDRAADIQASSNALAGSASHENIISAWATPLARVTQVGLNPANVSENVALLPLMDFDSSQGYYEKKTPEGKIIIEAQTGRVVPPHTYASFARAVVNAWMKSPGHRANIVNPKLRSLGCSARPTKTITGFDMVVGVQVFYTPLGTIRR